MAKILNASIDTTLGGENASNEAISSQKAIKTYVDTNTGDLSELATTSKTNLVSAINEVLDDISNLSYSTDSPALTPVSGVCTWVVTHNLGTQDIICGLYASGVEVVKDVLINSDNAITITFNSSESLSAGALKAVIFASGGAISSGGGGSYTLPVATTSTLGGVKIDGTSITIDNDGVISSTVDSTLSSTSTNPVQNKVIYPSLNNFIPAGTTFYVKTDGTGNFTKLSTVLQYLNGKWSNGIINIQFGSGTFTETSTLNIRPSNICNIPAILINGSGMDSTIISISNVSQYQSGIRFYDTGASIFLRNLTISIDNSTSGSCLCAQNTKISTQSINTTGGQIGYYCYNNGIIHNETEVSSTGCTFPVYAHDGTFNARNSTLQFSNATTAFTVSEAGIIKLSNCTKSFTNVTTFANQGLNQVTSSGFIISSIS